MWATGAAVGRVNRPDQRIEGLTAVTYRGALDVRFLVWKYGAPKSKLWDRTGTKWNWGTFNQSLAETTWEPVRWKSLGFWFGFFGRRREEGLVCHRSAGDVRPYFCGETGAGAVPADAGLEADKAESVRGVRVFTTGQYERGLSRVWPLLHVHENDKYILTNDNHKLS